MTMEIKYIELGSVRKAALSPQARTLYRALRRDFAEQLRSLIMSGDISTIGLIADRRIGTQNEVTKSWLALENALRELRRSCRGDGGGCA
jgi:hypothetical protein